MNYQKKSYPITQLATGEELFIHTYTFHGSKPGQNIYIQANLHGPEIIGTPLLGMLIDYIQNLTDIPGNITITPCANPIAVQQAANNVHLGRWNPKNGNNWNRIFTIHNEFTTHEEYIDYYEQVLSDNTSSIEQKLAAQLYLISYQAEYVLDIHTTGCENVNHLFTFERSHNIFSELGAQIHLETDPKNCSITFDESHIVPVLNQKEENWPHACTWEIHHHSHISQKILDQRFTQLKNWLHKIWDNKKSTKSPEYIISFEKTQHLIAPIGGYYIWQNTAGTVIKKNEVYAHVYQPHSQTFIEIKAQKDFIILGIYGIQAPSSGDEIAFIGFV